MAWEFEEIKRGNQAIRFTDKDAVRVRKTGLALAYRTWVRMGYPERVSVQVSTDLKAIRLGVPGTFNVTHPHPARGQQPSTVHVVSVDIGRKLAPHLGEFYLHTKENIFVLDSGTIEP